MKKSSNFSIVVPVFVLFVLTASITFGQTGPGGVGSSTNNRVWLDAHSLGLADGAPVSSWTDLSGNGANFNQGVVAKQPTYDVAGIGGIPSVSFDGIDDAVFIGAVPALETPNLTYFIVYDRIGLTTDMMITAHYTSTYNKWRTYSNNLDNTIINAQYSPAINWAGFSDPAGASFLSSHITPTNIRAYNQGNLMMTKTAAYTTPTGHLDVVLGNKLMDGTGTYVYSGDIAELVIFNTALNPLERILVENYLGAKYNMTIPVDRYAHQATHRYGLIALANDGTNTQTVARGSGMLELSSPASMGANEYFVVAHTDFPEDLYTDADIPPALLEYERLERTWRLDETGDVGTTTLTFSVDAGLADVVGDSYRLLIDSDGVFADATFITGVYDGVAGTVTFTTDLADNTYFTLAYNNILLEIHSITDGLWSETSTWDCTCIPSEIDHTFIDPFTTVTVDIDAFVGDFELQSFGTLIMNTDVTLDINGNWNAGGTADFTDGTVSFTSAGDQNIIIPPTSATTIRFNDLLIDNSSAGGVTFFNREYTVGGTLSPNQGNLIIDPSTTFWIESLSGTGGGRVGPIIPPATITGNVSVQRFIPAGSADWRNLCSPVNGSTFLTWDPNLAMSGPDFPDGCAFGEDDCFNSVIYWDNDVFVEVVSGSDPITNGRGYEIFVGDDLVSFSGTTLVSTGTLNSSADIVESYTSGWSTIGNPYASPITFSTLGLSGGIGNYFYVYDPATGDYEWYDGASMTTSIPSITADGLMATGQAVWIFADSPGSITFQQNDKSSIDATYIRSEEEFDPSLHLVLSENSSTYNADIHFQEDPSAVDGKDALLDIRHLSTGVEKAPSFTVVNNNEHFRKNYINNDGRDKSFELATKIKNEGFYTISAENWANFRSYAKILIHDHLTGEIVNLKDESYVFYAGVDNPEAKVTPRFTLILSNSVNGENDDAILSNLSTTEDELKIVQLGNIIDVQSTENYEDMTSISLTNVLGQAVVYSTTTSLVNGSNIITLPSNLKGVFMISIRTGNEVVTKKIIL
jgi:hypothetical protein